MQAFCWSAQILQFVCARAGLSAPMKRHAIASTKAIVRIRSSSFRWPFVEGRYQRVDAAGDFVARRRVIVDPDGNAGPVGDIGGATLSLGWYGVERQHPVGAVGFLHR